MYLKYVVHLSAFSPFGCRIKTKLLQNCVLHKFSYKCLARGNRAISGQRAKGEGGEGERENVKIKILITEPLALG